MLLFAYNLQQIVATLVTCNFTKSAKFVQFFPSTCHYILYTVLWYTILVYMRGLSIPCTSKTLQDLTFYVLLLSHSLFLTHCLGYQRLRYRQIANPTETPFHHSEFSCIYIYICTIFKGFKNSVWIMKFNILKGSTLYKLPQTIWLDIKFNK